MHPYRDRTRPLPRRNRRTPAFLAWFVANLTWGLVAMFCLGWFGRALYGPPGRPWDDTPPGMRESEFGSGDVYHDDAGTVGTYCKDGWTAEEAAAWSPRERDMACWLRGESKAGPGRSGLAGSAGASLLGRSTWLHEAR